MMREDRKDRVIRNEKIQSFERRIKMEQINNRMERIEEMQKERYLLDEERKKMEQNLNNKKSIMLDRLNKIIRSDENYTKEEIIDYVFRDIKPNTTKSLNNTKSNFKLYNDMDKENSKDMSNINNNVTEEKKEEVNDEQNKNEEYQDQNNNENNNENDENEFKENNNDNNKNNDN